MTLLTLRIIRVSHVLVLLYIELLVVETWFRSFIDVRHIRFADDVTTASGSKLTTS